MNFMALGGMALSLISGGFGWILRGIKHQRAKDSAFGTGMSILLRARLIDIHEKYVENNEPCPVDVKDEATSIYQAYHTLGGNGTGTHLYNEIMAAHIAKDGNL